LVERLRPHWQDQIITPKNRSGRPWGVGELEDHLLVLLILYRCAITQDFMACLYRTDKSAISRSLQRIESLAARVLSVKRAIRVSHEEAYSGSGSWPWDSPTRPPVAGSSPCLCRQRWPRPIKRPFCHRHPRQEDQSKPSDKRRTWV